MSGGKMLPTSQCELLKVNQVQFEMFTEKQLEQYAVCRVSEAKQFVNGVPVPGGLDDLRMGSTDFRFTCETCFMKHPECPGHFGYIELAEPMFNLGVFELTLQCLRCVCKSCGALLVDPTSDAVTSIPYGPGVNRLRACCHIMGNKSKCGIDDRAEGGTRGCGAEQPKLGRFKVIYPGLVIRAEEKDQELRWHADKARDVLDRISDEDARILGFKPERCHPRDLIIKYLPVPPPQVRPAVAFGTARSDHDFTRHLLKVLQENRKLEQLKRDRAGQQSIDEVRGKLQELIATYFHNASTFYKPAKGTGRTPLKSLTERLKGKFGRLRGNLMGKRVDFSARTVITGDPNIDVDEVGVPMSIAMTLTFPERVNHINRKRLTEVVRRTQYPSANYIIHPNGVVKKLELTKKRSDITLQIGDVVERHVTNGDVVLFNRQPTLHRMSMMGHRVRVLPYNTFRLNLSCTTPYNADFDGDEMNLHVPQSLLTKGELIEMMMVPKNFVTPNKSAPCMGIVQDSLLGCYRVTDKDTFLDKYFVQCVAMWIDQWDLPIPAILKPRPLWTGKQLFSLILPEVNLEVAGKSKKFFSDQDDYLIIRRGKVLCGLIKKNFVGVASGSLIHLIFNEKGSDEVSKFINGVQRITTAFLYNYSFSVGIQDTVAGKSTLANVNQILKKANEKVRKLGCKANEGTLARRPGMTLLQSFEKEVNTALNEGRVAAAKEALNNVKRTNSFKVMIEAGSKGSDLNICQIAVLVGQQNVNGQRIPFGFRRRTLPHFMQDDYGESSRGLVNRGYVEGLKPHEFYFHTMGGREGLIDTAVKTADTGYLQRKLIKALEDVHIAYDGTVRNANRQIVQMVYGEDGLNGASIEGGQVVDIVTMDNNELKEAFRYEYGEDGSFTERIGEGYMTRDVKRSLAAREHVQKLEEEYQQLLADRDNARKWIKFDKKPIKLSLPINIERLVRNAQHTIGKRSQMSNLSPIDVIDGVTQLQNDLKQFFASYNRTTSCTFGTVYNRERVEGALKLITFHLRSMLASKRVIKDYKLSDKAFEYLLGEIRVKFHQSMIQAGEMVGAIAAQSCGEPATQMTLNTFHNAGISSKNVTLGVPRLLELLNVSKTQKISNMNISLVDKSKTNAESCLHKIENCTLETVTKKWQIIYDPNPRRTIVEEDQEMVRLEWDNRYLAPEEQEEQEKLCESGSPWVVRLALDYDLLVDKRQQNMRTIRKEIHLREPNKYFIETTQFNATRNPMIRLRSFSNKVTIADLKREIPNLLSKVHLCGVPGIKKVLTTEVKSMKVDKETGSVIEDKSWALETEGTALRTVMGCVVDEEGKNIVDFRSTTSNNIPEVYSVLGIEAARMNLFNEMQAAYLAYGVYINYRHYSVLTEAMCQRGYLMAISRVGINRSDAKPLMRCSFEETVKVLMHAAAFGENDDVRGVSSNLVLGNQSRVGTGIFDLMLDMDGLRSAVTQENAVLPGREVNVYHGLSSLQPNMSSVAPRVGQATPRATDPSIAHGSARFPGSELGNLGIEVTPMVREGDVPLSSAPFRAEDFSVDHSVQSSIASIYNPVTDLSTDLPSAPVEAEASLQFQSSEYDYNPFRALSGIPSVHSSPVYGLFGAQGVGDSVRTGTAATPYDDGSTPYGGGSGRPRAAAPSASYVPMTSGASGPYGEWQSRHSSGAYPISTPEYVPETPADMSSAYPSAPAQQEGDYN